ncbi:hypothetical protein MRB53_039677 [Persea americana]|nr:hypothetical protein MRB53_039677 [Persea americana]
MEETDKEKSKARVQAIKLPIEAVLYTRCNATQPSFLAAITKSASFGTTACSSGGCQSFALNLWQDWPSKLLSSKRGSKGDQCRFKQYQGLGDFRVIGNHWKRIGATR